VPRAWYARLNTFLLEHGYVMESVDKTLFTLNHGNDFLLVQIYMYDIIFGGYSHTRVRFSGNDGERVSDANDWRTNFFS
jgi:hypothetical protein